MVNYQGERGERSHYPEDYRVRESKFDDVPWFAWGDDPIRTEEQRKSFASALAHGAEVARSFKRFEERNRAIVAARLERERSERAL